MTAQSLQNEFSKFLKSIIVEDGDRKDTFKITSKLQTEPVAEVTKFVHICGWDFKLILEINGEISKLNIDRKFDIIEHIILLHLD